MTHHIDPVDSTPDDAGGASALIDPRVVVVVVWSDSVRRGSDLICLVALDPLGRPYFPQVPVPSLDDLPTAHLEAAGVTAEATALPIVWSDRAHGWRATVGLRIVAASGAIVGPRAAWMRLSALQALPQSHADVTTLLTISWLAKEPTSRLAGALSIPIA